MSLYVSPITQMITSNGVSVRMTADIAVPLPELLIATAFTKGVTGQGGELAERNEKTALGATVEEVVLAIRELMESGDAKAFSVSGEPKLNVLKGKLGKSVTDAVRDIAWAEVVAARGED